MPSGSRAQIRAEVDFVKTKQTVDAAIAEGREPRRVPSNKVTLATGQRSYLVLSNADASVTRAGTYYYAQTAQRVPEVGYDERQELRRRGAGDYIKTRDGKERLVRRVGVDGVSRVTALGKKYFAQSNSQYIVHIPVWISGARKGGAVYRRPSSLPVDALGVGVCRKRSIHRAGERGSRQTACA